MWLLSWSLLALATSAARLSDQYSQMSLEECQNRGEHFCFTGTVPDRDLINSVIESNSSLRAVFERLRPSASELRRKRETETADCTSVCCALTDSTPPFSFFMDKDGWQQVASTPEHPQRVSFFRERCRNLNAPCRGLKSLDDDLIPQCIQVSRKHAILVFNRTTGIQTRYVEVPSACKCKLLPQNPFDPTTS